MLAGLLTLCLPETGDEDLPDTVAEAEHIGEHKKTELYDDNTLVRSEDCAPTQYSEVISVHTLCDIDSLSDGPGFQKLGFGFLKWPRVMC